MTEPIKYRISHLKITYGLRCFGMDFGKVIIYRENERKLGIYATHEGISDKAVKDFGLDLDRVLGGARYELSGGRLVLSHCLESFGSIPTEAAEEIQKELANHLRQKGIPIASLENNIEQSFHHRRNREAWRSLGFDVSFSGDLR